MIGNLKAGRFAIGIVLLYLIAIAPALVRHGFDASVFIVAGDQFVDRAQLASPIIVRPNSDGYDGQFYYRLALAPFDLSASVNGVTFDAPPWRMQRIVYPLLAWALSLGQPWLVPMALLCVNLIGIGLVALFALRLSRRLDLPDWLPLAITLWPGFIVTLTHDTTEIISAVLLLAAIDQYFANRLWRFAALGALGCLTRETGLFAVGGLLLYELWRRNARAVVACAAALAPALVWRELQRLLWGASLSSSVAGNVSWPLLGVIQAMASMIRGDYVAIPGLKGIVLRGFAFVSAGLLVAFCSLVATRISRGPKAVAAAWLPLLALMSLLSAQAPWIEPIAYLRAFTECWVVGCLLLDAGLARSRFAKPALAVLSVIWIGAGWLSTSTIN